MIETTIYRCEICGAEFDDEYEAHCHEFVCRYNETKKLNASCLGFYKEDGTEIKFDNPNFVWDEFDDIAAFIVGNDDDVMYVNDIFAYHGYESPFRAIVDNEHPKYYGLWWFDPDLHYGEWVRVDDQIKKWVDIKNKFTKDA